MITREEHRTRTIRKDVVEALVGKGLDIINGDLSDSESGLHWLNVNYAIEAGAMGGANDFWEPYYYHQHAYPTKREKEMVKKLIIEKLSRDGWRAVWLWGVTLVVW